MQAAPTGAGQVLAVEQPPSEAEAALAATEAAKFKTEVQEVAAIKIAVADAKIPSSESRLNDSLPPPLPLPLPTHRRALMILSTLLFPDPIYLFARGPRPPRYATP